jgi:hypothetical protein
MDEETAGVGDGCISGRLRRVNPPEWTQRRHDDAKPEVRECRPTDLGAPQASLVEEVVLNDEGQSAQTSWAVG